MPFIVSVPSAVVKLPPPLTERLPVRMSVADEVTVPEIVRSLKVQPLPVIVFEVPDSVRAPVECMNDPDPVVDRFPATVMAAEDEVMLAPVKSRL